MTQAKVQCKQKSSEAVEINELNSRERKIIIHEMSSSKGFLSDNCIQLTACLLLTVGLCIIATTFYLAIHQQRLNDGYDDTPNAVSTGDPVPPAPNNNRDLIAGLSKSVRAIGSDIGSLINSTFSGCHSYHCKMICMRAGNIYSALHQTLLESNCIIQENLLITQQQLPDDVLSNQWPNSQNLVKELIISHSKISRIQGETFNTPLFATTQMITFDQLDLHNLEGSTLVGLHSLKYLVITTPLEHIDRAFFQPVQTSLTHLVVNAGLTIGRDHNLCGISRLHELEHLDLSRNNFVASISHRMFRSTPNLKYLIITEAKVTYIEPDAFSALAGRLQLLNLSQNFLTTLAANAIEPILRGNALAFISLSLNNWLCDCSIMQLAGVVRTYRTQFIDEIYCKSPHYFYGVNVERMYVILRGCHEASAEYEDEDDDDSSELEISVLPTPSIPSDEISNDNTLTPGGTPPNEDDAKPTQQTVFKMRCLNSYQGLVGEFESNDTQSDNGGHQPVADVDAKPVIMPTHNGSNNNPVIDLRSKQSVSEDFSFRFDLPDYEFELRLLSNHSVQVSIKDHRPTSPVFVLWFSNLPENFSMLAFDDCIEYANPLTITEPLIENSTYTFCLLPDTQSVITPFNCLPLYVPPISVRDDNIWISADSKHFTIAMLCLIFMLSAFLGAVIAYFGIKAYPDLLEGSKNVLVVRKSDQTCYVSTISKGDYTHHSSSMKKKPLGGLPPLKNQTLNSLVLDSDTYVPTPPPLPAYAKQPLAVRERLPSLKSISSTCFEDSFGVFGTDDDEYEMPTSSDQPHRCGEQCHQNSYALSPCQPPPLPRRNSYTAELMPGLVLNRFARQPLVHNTEARPKAENVEKI